MDKEQIRPYLSDLWRSLIHAGMSFQVWRVLMEGTMEAKFEKDHAQEWVASINSYPGFFELAIRSCEMYFLISLHNFFHANRHSASISGLVTRLKKGGNISLETFKKFQSTLDENAELLTKVKTIRDQAIAHRDEKSFLTNIFAENGPQAVELDRLIQIGHDLLNLVGSESAGRSYSADIKWVEQDTKALMKTLKAKKRD